MDTMNVFANSAGSVAIQVTRPVFAKQNNAVNAKGGIWMANALWGEIQNSMKGDREVRLLGQARIMRQVPFAQYFPAYW